MYVSRNATFRVYLLRSKVRSMSAEFGMCLSHLDNGLSCVGSARASAQHGLSVQDVYRSMIGSLAFASVTIRWDIAHSVSVLSRYLMKPNRKVIAEARRVIQYLMTMRDFKIRWTSEEDKLPADLRNKLWGAADASYASDVITRRSHGGYMLFLNGGCVSWKSGLQKMVT